MPTVTCPKCDERIQVSRGQIGRKVKCPECGAGFFADDGTEPVVAVQPAKKKRPRLLLAAGVGVCLFFCCAGVGGFLNTKPVNDFSKPQPAIGRDANGQVIPPQAAPVAAAPPSRSRKYSREEFRAAVLGKTGDEVMQLLGRPKQTQELGDQTMWYYERRTVDPVSGKTDYTAQLVIEGGRVSEVNFN